VVKLGESGADQTSEELYEVKVTFLMFKLRNGSVQIGNSILLYPFVSLPTTVQPMWRRALCKGQGELYLNTTDT
jgi:hypothetical protein